MGKNNVKESSWCAGSERDPSPPCHREETDGPMKFCRDKDYGVCHRHR